MKSLVAALTSTLFIVGCGQSATLGSDPGEVVDGVGAASLRAAAASTGRYFGSAVSGGGLEGDPRYPAIAAAEFSIMTPENAMKWDATEPALGQLNFREGDLIVNFAQSHNARVHGHALVWHSQLPGYMNYGLSADAVRQAMLNHIKAVASHYAGKIYSWDVVNEAIDDNQGGALGLRSSIFSDKLGPSFIADAFRAAHEADPQARLFYNDYGAEWNNGKTDRIFTLVKSLVDAGVPIHGVGLQCHFDGWNMPSRSTIGAVVKRFASLGLKVRFSELDVSMRGYPGNLNDQLNAQGRTYAAIVGACLDSPACDAVIVWQFADSYSWIPGFTGHPEEKPLPWDNQMQRKPAYYGILNALSAAQTTPSTDSPIVASAAPNFCLDVPRGNAVNGARVQVYSCNGTSAQQWRYEGGAIKIQGKCLDTPAFLQSNGMWLQIWDCTGAPNQQWQFDAASSVIRLAGTNMCLDVPNGRFADAAPATIYQCNGGTAQRFTLGGVTTLKNTVQSLLNPEYCMRAVGGANPTDGARVELQSCGDASTQKFTYVNGTLRYQDKCLDDPGFISDDGTWLQLWTCSGGKNQQWVYEQGSHVIRLAGTNKCIDNAGGNVGAGTRPVIWTCNGKLNQQWGLN